MKEGRASIPVLFVDDEENILRAIARLFLDEPFEILTASSGAAGLDLLKTHPGIGVIVSDQRMPVMSGAEFLEQSRALAPEAIRLVLTGYADVTAAIDAINKGGAWKYLTKPWKDEELIQMVREAVERFSLLAENRRLTETVSRQNEELKKWSGELEVLVQQQTIEIQKKNETLERLNERLRKNFTDTLHAFSGLLELRDKSAGSHSKNVSELAGGMARQLKLSPEETSVIIVAALLHDIGKIGVPDAVLCMKFEGMTPENKNLYMSHAVRGQTAVDAVEDLRKAGVLIRHHHEAWNGHGFPDRLAGNAIPLGSRIIGLADYFDRAVASIPGEDAVENALLAVKQNLGTRFDGDLFATLEQYSAPMQRAARRSVKTLERELTPAELTEGMVLTREVRSGTGVLLLNTGTALSQKNIQAVIRYFKIDPSRENIFVAAK